MNKKGEICCIFLNMHLLLLQLIRPVRLLLALCWVFPTAICLLPQRCLGSNLNNLIVWYRARQKPERLNKSFFSQNVSTREKRELEKNGRGTITRRTSRQIIAVYILNFYHFSKIFMLKQKQFLTLEQGAWLLFNCSILLNPGENGAFVYCNHHHSYFK